MLAFLQNLPGRLRRSYFVRNILVIMSGTAIAQVIGFGLSPVISRLFSPSDFGIFGSFSAIAGVIAAGVTLEYSQAVMLPKEKETAINLLAVALFCSFAVSFLCMGVCLIVPGTINGLMKTTAAWPLALLVLATLVAGVNQSCQAWAVRSKAFKRTSASQVVRSVSSSSMRIGLGYLKGGSGALIVSSIVADIMATVTLAGALLPDWAALRTRIRWGLMRSLAHEYRDFPLYSASQAVINALSSGLPVLLLTRYYGIAVAGAYAFGITILQVPTGFVSAALRQVLFQRACESQHEGGSLAALYVRTTAILFALAIVPSVILILWAPQLFSWIFGSRWFLAGELARSLVIWLAVSFCNLPAVLFARIIRIQRFVFFYDMALLTMRFLALIVGGSYLNVRATVMLFSVVGSLMNAFLIFRVGRVVMKKEGPGNWESLREIMKGA